MDAGLIAIIMLLPFALLFLYSGIHEYQRYKSEGRARYGLVYDEESGTTHVTAIAEDAEGYYPDEFDPGDHNGRETSDETADDRA
jgi:hypothetical protein